MKPPVRLLLPILIPALLLAGAAGCSSTSDEADNGEGEPAEPVSIAGVTGHAVRVEWRNLSTRRQDFIVGFQGGHADGEPPLFDRFTIGNTATLRGWDKFDVAPLGGTRLLYGSLEYRYRPFQLFYDIGRVWVLDP